MTETKLETFQRLFPGRATKVLDTLRIAGHCMKSHMEADTELTDKFVRDVRDALDVFPPLPEDTLTVSFESGGPIEPEPSILGTHGAEMVVPPDHERELEDLHRLRLDRAKVAYALSKLEKAMEKTPSSPKQLEAVRKLLLEGIGREDHTVTLTIAD